jgi:hypothetical protein
MVTENLEKNLIFEWTKPRPSCLPIWLNPYDMDAGRRQDSGRPENFDRRVHRRTRARVPLTADFY